MTTDQILETRVVRNWPDQEPMKRLFCNAIKELEFSAAGSLMKDFKLDALDYPVILKLLAYFYRDEQWTDYFKLDLNKGILLTGPVGCGKTTIMRAFTRLLPKGIQFGIKACREITFELEEEGTKVIGRYSKTWEARQYSIAKPYCFDDLGVEQTANWYGKEYNVMAEIIQSRYDYLLQRGLLTHFTTNLNAKEIEDIYGPRIRSRLNEMVNLISFDKTSTDKRKLSNKF